MGISRVHAANAARVVAMVMAGAVGWMCLGCASTGGASGGEGATEENPVFHQVTEADVRAVESKEPLSSDGALLYVNGMGCPLCATNIDRLLARKRSISTAVIDLGAGTVLVGFEGGRAKPSPYDLREWVADAGFTLVKVVPQ
ncbi:MAG: heavy metal-associated domain-containing protein [Planctomycetota bacterium]|nr:heavy metal-associated domain-containing protein [Planctomycetota bacterium]